MAIEPITDMEIESPVSLNLSENPAVKKLLDVIVLSLAEEYIQTARENPEIFTI